MSPSTKEQRKKTNSKKGATAIRDPKAKPKRPLSAYNLFFQYERDRLLRSKPSKAGQSHEQMHMTIHIDPSERRNRSKTVRPPPHGKIGFAELAKMIGQRWKSLDSKSREHFQGLAAIEKKRYVEECQEWKARVAREAELEEAAAKEAAAERKDQQDNVDDDADIAAVDDVEAVTVEDNITTAPHQQQHSSQQDVYNMLHRACEIAEGGISQQVQSTTGGNILRQEKPLNFATGAPSSYHNNNGYSGYINNHHQHHHQPHTAFAPPVRGNAYHPSYANVALNEPAQDHQYLANSLSKTIQRQPQPADMYQHALGVPPIRDCRTNVSHPARIVNGGSEEAMGMPVANSASGSTALSDTDILDFLSRIVSD